MPEHRYPPGLARRHECRENGKLTCAGAFRCSTCRKIVGWCMGGDFDAADPNGDKCIDCWHETFRKFPVVVKRGLVGTWLVIRRLPTWAGRPAVDEIEASRRTRAAALRHARKVSEHVVAG